MSTRTLLGAAAGLMLIALIYVLQAATASTAEVAVAMGIFLLAVAILALAWRRIAKSFDALEKAARNLADGRTPGVLESLPSSEATPAATAFNLLAEAVSERIAAAGLENEHLKAALNSSSDAVVALDSDGRIQFANVAAESLFSKTSRELLGTPFVWVMAEEHVVDAIRASRDEGRRSTTVIERPNRQFLRALTSPIVGGGAWATLVVIQDLTDVRRVEQVRRDFVANVSHELRTPLAALKSVIETLEAGALDDPPVARDFLARADSEIDRLVQMVEELLELSRIESGEIPLADELVDLNSVVANAIERMRRQADRAGINLTADVPSDPAMMRGDPVRLERAVLNLLHNAVKFTPEGGDVHVSVSTAGGEVAVVVRDTGIGIDAEDLPRVFERFYKTDRSRRAGGTGLGLAVVKHTVEAHGGRVWAESQPEKGSAFGFAIPLPAER